MSTPNTHIGVEGIRSIMENARGRTVFFLGAGGIMMSSLALLTERAGFTVRGSDRARSQLTEKLEVGGITMFYSHAEENLGEDCGALVYTVAVSPDNPEYARAQKEGIPTISRADYLGYLMTSYRCRIGVAGMHGKSSCTSMLAEILLTAAKAEHISEPTIVSGATYAPMGGAYHLGAKDYFLFEACEYMDSFLDFNPTVAVLLNAEMEHVDYFKSIEQIRNSFTRYASLVGKKGKVVYNADDENICLAVASVSAEKLSFGIEREADLRAVNISLDCYPIEFDVLYKGAFFAHATLPALGLHSVYNGLAAVAAGIAAGMEKHDIFKALSEFKGAGRRMEYKGDLNGAAVFDDYGHHPTEVGATLKGARTICHGRLFCVFQPHTYSRTAALQAQFPEAFASADRVILADIYAAREENLYGISSEKLAESVGEKATYGGDLDAIAETLRAQVEKDDMVVVMGAGDIFKLFPKLGL